MLLSFDNGKPFAQGACTYSYRLASSGGVGNRVFAKVRIANEVIEAALDTGGVYFVCDPDIAGRLNLDPAEGIPVEGFQHRGFEFRGTLYRIPLQIVADEGYSLEIEVVMFVPRPRGGEQWGLPSFLGMTGCLERVRFAVDPGAEKFYFGAIDWENG